MPILEHHNRNDLKLQDTIARFEVEEAAKPQPNRLKSVPIGVEIATEIAVIRIVRFQIASGLDLQSKCFGHLKVQSSDVNHE